MDAPPRPPAWTGIAARAAGAWILFGCLMKAFLGTPADLPEIVRRVPLPIGTTFVLVLGIEAFVGLTMMLRPGRAWPLEGLILIAFATVLVTQVAAGVHSCGCFGATIPVPPWLMLVLDLVFLAAMFAARPWRLPRGGRPDVVVGLLALVVAVALPLSVDREAAPGGATDGGGNGLRRWASLDVPSWTGKKIRETSLSKWADLTDARDGLWLVYRESCEICAECLEWMAGIEMGEREITLVRLGERGEAGAKHVVHTMPTGPFVHRIDLPDTVDWVVTAPVRVIVVDGVVTEAKEGIPADACR